MYMHSDRPGFNLLEDFPEDQEYLYSWKYRGHTCTLVSHYFTELPHPGFDFPHHEFNLKTSDMIKIDNRLVPVITSLWGAKIPTQYCCSGNRRTYDKNRIICIKDRGMLLFHNYDHEYEILDTLKDHGFTNIRKEYPWESRLHFSFDRITQ